MSTNKMLVLGSSIRVYSCPFVFYSFAFTNP